VVLNQAGKLTADESFTFEESYGRLKAMCTFIATNITRDIGLAEDVVHNAFVKIMEHRDRYFALPVPKRDAYIVVMVKNRAIDTMRSKASSAISTDDLSEKEWESIAVSDVEKAYEDKEGYGNLLKLIKELPPLYQVVFEMRYLEGFSNDEIAEILGIKKSAVAVQLKRAREKMQKKIGAKAIIIMICIAVSALMFNGDVRAATLGRLINWWQNLSVLTFHGQDSDSSLRHYFWTPEYVPSDFHVQFSEQYYDAHTGAFTQINFAGENLFIMFSAHWMWWFEDGTTGGGRGIPTDDIDHTIMEHNGVTYHVVVAQTQEATARLGGLPVSVFWEHRGFEFQILGNAEPDLLVDMALSVEPVR